MLPKRLTFFAYKHGTKVQKKRLRHPKSPKSFANRLIINMRYVMARKVMKPGDSL